LPGYGIHPRPDTLACNYGIHDESPAGCAWSHSRLKEKEGNG